MSDNAVRIETGGFLPPESIVGVEGRSKLVCWTNHSFDLHCIVIRRPGGYDVLARSEYLSPDESFSYDFSGHMPGTYPYDCAVDPYDCAVGPYMRGTIVVG